MPGFTWKASHDRAREGERERAAQMSNIFEQGKVDMVTRWEVSTAATMERNAVQKRVVGLRARYQASVAERRSRLQTLLAADRKALDDELRSVHESPEQRAKRLMETAHALRDKREAARLEKVEYELNRQFRQGLDEFRTEDTKARLHDVDKFRHVQMAEKIARKNEEAQMDLDAAEAWRLSLLKGADRTDRETLAKYAANVETTRVLGTQLVEKGRIVAYKSSQKAAEEVAMRERWSKRESEERARGVAAEAHQAAELAKMNEWKVDRDGRLAREARVEQEADLERLRATLAREKAKDDEEAAERERQKLEGREYQRHLLLQMQKEAEDDSELQRIMKQYEEEKWAKRERQWGGEREARERLMTEVFAGRVQQGEFAKARVAAIAEEDARYAALVQTQLRAANAAEEHKQVALKQKHLAYQDEILEQIEAKRLREAARVDDINAHHESMLELQRTHRAKIDHMRATEAPQVSHARKTGQWYW